MSGANVSNYILKQLAMPPIHQLESGTPHIAGESVRIWITRRVLELSYTAVDLKGFAEELGYVDEPFAWDESRRFLLRCELDAAFFHLYGIAREDVDYIMETFPIVRRRDGLAHGEYRTKRVILELYDAMERAAGGGEPYRTPLDPPPAFGWSPAADKAVV